MSKYKLAASAAAGLESVVSRELKELGYENITVENGRIFFEGDETDIVRCNLWLRSAGRVFIVMADYQARDFEVLFQGVKSVEWEKFIPENGKMHVTGKAVKSELMSISDCQSIVKKAMVESMQRKYSSTRFKEDGPVFKVNVSIVKNRVLLLLDTSGEGLHKRGYRLDKGVAPLRETLAAAIILLSRWKPDRPFADLLCGAGTIPIEAAMIGKKIAPGINRNFAAEEWPFIPKKIWNSEREKAREMIIELPEPIMASDMEWTSFKKARTNAENAGVVDDIIFQKKPLIEFSSKKKYGCMISNPPYGERIGNENMIKEINRDLGKVYAKLDDWSVFILSGNEDFQKHFGKRADKNRKLYNGKIKTYLYQYFGKMPKKSY